MKPAIAARFLGDGHRQQRLALLADLGPLGDMAQPVEVQVGAAVDRDEAAVLELAPLGILLQAGEADGAGRLGDGAGVVEDVLDRGADLVGIDGDDLVEQLAAQAEGLRAGLAHGHAVGEQADLIEHHALAGGDRRLHAGGVVRLDADHLHLGPQELDVGGDAGGEPAAADRHEDRLDRVRVLAQDLHADRALAGDHVGVVVRVDEGQALLRLRARGRGRRPRRSCRRAARRGRPARCTACTLMAGVVRGITITAFAPSFCAASATPWAWLPAEAQITPRSSSS